MVNCNHNKQIVKYILIGGDGDLIFELELNRIEILGYTATIKKEDIKYRYLGEAQALNLNGFPNDAGVLVAVDDIELRH